MNSGDFFLSLNLFEKLNSVVRPVPTMHGQGGTDDTDESFNKTNGSISLKPESSDEEHEDNYYSMKKFQTDSTKNDRTEEASSRLKSEINEKSYSSNVPNGQNSLSWLNQGLAKLIKVNSYRI